MSYHPEVASRSAPTRVVDRSVRHYIHTADGSLWMLSAPRRDHLEHYRRVTGGHDGVAMFVAFTAEVWDENWIRWEVGSDGALRHLGSLPHPGNPGRLVGVCPAGTGSAALDADGRVWLYPDPDTTPTDAGIDDAVAVFGVFMAAYVLDRHGQLWAIGDNTSGQAGTGTTNPHDNPVQVAIPTPVAAVACSAEAAFAVDVDGGLWAWGWRADPILLGPTTRGERHVTLRPTPARLDVKARFVDVWCSLQGGLGARSDTGEMWDERFDPAESFVFGPVRDAPAGQVLCATPTGMWMVSDEGHLVVNGDFVNCSATGFVTLPPIGTDAFDMVTELACVGNDTDLSDLVAAATRLR